MGLSAEEKLRRSRVRSAFLRAEQDLHVAEIIDALDISGPRYSQFKGKLYIGKIALNKWEKWLRKKGYLGKPGNGQAREDTAPYSTAPDLVEISSILRAMLNVTEDKSDKCSVAQLSFLESGARRISDDLVPLLLERLEEDNGGT